MSIYRTSDSLSRCDPSAYSHFYDVNRKPTLKPDDIQAPPSMSKDTIEMSRDKLKKEALEKLRHTSKFTVAQVGFVRIGKYLFTALAFPPYLLGIKLPQLVFGHLLLPTMRWVMQVSVKLNQKIKKPVVHILQRVIQWRKQSRLLAQRLIKPFIHSILSFNKRVGKFFKLVGQRFQALQNMPRLAFSNLRKGVAKSREKLTNYRLKISSRLVAGAKIFTQIPEWVGALPKLSLPSLPTFEKLRENLKTNRQKACQQAKQKANQAGQAVKNVLGEIKKPFIAVSQQIQQFVQPLAYSLLLKLKNKGNQAKEFSQKQQKRALNFFKKRQEKLKNTSYLSFVNRLLMSQWITGMPSAFQQWLKKLLVSPFVMALGRSIVKIYVSLAQTILNMPGYLIKLFSQLGSVSLQKIKAIGQGIRNNSQKIKQLVTNSYRKMIYLMLKGIYQISVWIFIVGILSIRGCRLIVEWSKDLDQRTSFMRR